MKINTPLIRICFVPGPFDLLTGAVQTKGGYEAAHMVHSG